MEPKIVGRLQVSPEHQLIKRQALLDLVTIQDTYAGYALPAQDDPDDGVDYPELYITADDFRAMGEPQQITVTIEPGDQMNGATS